ncbi:uncharacterized protein LOC135811867 [Sycon ciliatum]|uniref:uncharacterized protein LOC135811867 n=1 Tax=Sycon ciliatum TaxID=27933 RepID=UPI0020AD528F|eukprot:scpid59558/ scgid4106/ 
MWSWLDRLGLLLALYCAVLLISSRSCARAASTPPTSSSVSSIQCSPGCRAGDCDGTTGICYRCDGTANYVHIPSGVCSASCPLGKAESRIYTGPKTFYGLVCTADATGVSPVPSTQSSAGQPASGGNPVVTSAAGDGTSGLSGAATGGIIGGAVGVLIIAAGVLFVVYFYRSRRELALTEASAHVNMRELRQAPSNSNLRGQRGARQPMGGIEEEETETAAASGNNAPDSGPSGNTAAALSPGRRPAQKRVELSSEERDTFFAKLDEIRPNVATLLEILNATNKARRKTADKEEGMKFKLAMDDMAAVLRLANRKPTKVTIPDNGVQLVTWAAGLIASYKQSQAETEVAEGL